MSGSPELADLAVVGSGAAGLMAAIFAGRTASVAGRRLRIVAIDGAASLGAKILIAGGGRCNVTHHEVATRDFSGSSAAAIAKVLRRFGVAETCAFFESLGVELKREGTGKLFPVADDARVVLEALLAAARDAGVELRHPCRVQGVLRRSADPAFRLESASGEILARRVILATGGRSLPRTGSDGTGHAIARSLGHSLTPLVTPALVPLLLAEGHWIRGLSGVATPAGLTLRSGGGKVLRRIEGSLLCTHFGLSGPAALDMSRFWIHTAAEDPAATLELSWLAGATMDEVDRSLLATGRNGVLAWLRERLPERVARALLAETAVDPAISVQQWPRERRRHLAAQLVATPLPIVGDRGFGHAEVTAGGVPLAELHLATMESRLVPGLHLCGEICDVDGRIGGFNFQWAWASGFVAGTAAAAP
jgi:predicted Rossmann fold flavoprotein